MCIVKIYILPCVILFAGMWLARSGEDMDNKELTEDEKAAITKLANILAEFVLDEIENDKKRTNSYNNDPHIKELTRNLAEDLLCAFSWKDTKEGHKYWADICHRLRRIAEEGF